MSVKSMHCLNIAKHIVRILLSVGALLAFVGEGDVTGFPAFSGKGALAATMSDSIERILNEPNKHKKRRFGRDILNNQKALISLLFQPDSAIVFNKLRSALQDIQPNLRKVNMNNISIPGINFEGVDLYLARLRGANLEGANLRGAYLYQCHCHRIVLVHADLSRGDDGTSTVMANAYLHEANLSGANLRGADFLDSSLTGIVLDNAQIGDAIFSGSNLIKASLRNVHSQGGTYFNRCLITYADLTDGDLKRCKMRGGVLSHSNLTRANFWGLYTLLEKATFQIHP